MLREKHFFFCFSCSVRIIFCHFWHPSAVILPKKKCSFCCGGVAKVEIVLPMLRGKHFFLCFSCSMRSAFLKSTWPLVYKWYFLGGGELACSCGAVHGFVMIWVMINSFANFPSNLKFIQHVRYSCIYAIYTTIRTGTYVYIHIYIYIYIYHTYIDNVYI